MGVAATSPQLNGKDVRDTTLRQLGALPDELLPKVDVTPDT